MKRSKRIQKLAASETMYSILLFSQENVFRFWRFFDTISIKVDDKNFAQWILS